MKKYGFLFGAGAEFGYNMPSGGQFALDIFRQDPEEAKKKFRKMKDAVAMGTSYADEWLPDGYKQKRISAFGQSVFESIITSTLEHNRMRVIEKMSAFDNMAHKIANQMCVDGLCVDSALRELLGKDLENMGNSQEIELNRNLSKGNQLFRSKYFTSLLYVYNSIDKLSNKTEHDELHGILRAIIQLHLGALGEDLTHSINDNILSKNEVGIDLFDDFGELIKINYKAAGVEGLEILRKNKTIYNKDPIGIVLSFANKLLAEIYASVLDYKSVIDSHWHYLYQPKSDWAKFCKISIFLLIVCNYISELSEKANINNLDGYYHLVRNAVKSGLFDITAVATTNYSSLIKRILEQEITYLNGSTCVWYDPYLNKTGTVNELSNDEHHIIVPLLFTQSGTKPMTSIDMAAEYVDLYRKWKESDAIVVVGFGFNADDEHIVGILRTLVDSDGKDLIVITRDSDQERICKQAKFHDDSKVKVIEVDLNGMVKGEHWVDLL